MASVCQSQCYEKRREKNRNLGWAKILLWFVTLARPKIHHCVQTHLWFYQDYNNCSHDELLVEHDQELLKIDNIKLVTIMPGPECRSVVQPPLYLLVNQFVTVDHEDLRDMIDADFQILHSNLEFPFCNFWVYVCNALSFYSKSYSTKRTLCGTKRHKIYLK